MDDVRIEQVTTLADCERCHDLAAQVWGGESACSVPQMIVHATHGGIVLLALIELRPIGFLFSFPAQYRGRFVLWSHETAILPEYAGAGIGYLLKNAQRRRAVELGYTEIVWTFDPLVSRNAYFNLVKLGARIAEYQVNVYGSDASDLVNQGLETDRFIAVWPVASDVAPSSIFSSLAHDKGTQSSNHEETALVLGSDERPETRTIASDTETIFTEIPPDFSLWIGAQPSLAQEWRLAFREVAQNLMRRGYRPVSVRRSSTARVRQYVWKRTL